MTRKGNYSVGTVNNHLYDSYILLLLARNVTLRPCIYRHFCCNGTAVFIVCVRHNYC